MKARGTTLMAGLLGATLLAAGTGKVADLAAWHLTLRQMDLGTPWSATAILSLPGIEMVAGLALLSRSYRHPAAWLALVLLLAFSLWLGGLWIKGYTGSCGCFPFVSGDVIHLTPGLSLLRNLLLAGAAAWLVYATKPAEAHRPAADQGQRPPPGT
jgi:uncharacterized membrane protein YphA (DoxX/SURF4 family)